MITSHGGMSQYASDRDAIDEVAFQAASARQKSIVSVACLAAAIACIAIILSTGGGNPLGWVVVTILGLLTWDGAVQTSRHREALGRAIAEARASAAATPPS